MRPFNIHLTGVGGQGIGMLSEIVLRAADHAGHVVKGVDTHGLAQRGGIVVSRIRIGSNAHSPLIQSADADLGVALERHEAYRALTTALRDGATLVYYDTVWQPLEVRLGHAEATTTDAIDSLSRSRNVRALRVFREDLEDARMQNMVVLAHLDRHQVIPGITADHYRQAMADLMDGTLLETNRALFEAERVQA